MDLPGGLDLKLDIFCYLISIRSTHLNQGIFPCGQLFNIPENIRGDPVLYHISFCIFDGQMRARQLFLSRDILLGNLHTGNIIPHDHSPVLQQSPVIEDQPVFIRADIHIVFRQHVSILVLSLYQLEPNAFCFGKAIRDNGFHQCVHLVQFKATDLNRLITADPLAHHSTILILNGQSRTGQFLVTGELPLADEHAGAFVLTHAFQHLNFGPGVGKGELHWLIIQEVAGGGTQFTDDISPTVLVIGLTITDTLHGQVTVKHDRSILSCGGRGRQQITGSEQAVAVGVVDIILRIQVEHRTGQSRAGLLVQLDDLDLCLFPLVVELQNLLLGELGSGLLRIDDLELAGNSIAVFVGGGDGFGHDHTARLLIPLKGHIVTLRGAGITIGRLCLLNVIAAQRQGHGNLANLVMNDRQEIVGSLSSAGTEHCNIAGAVTGGDHCHHIPLGIPQGAVTVGIGLAILGIDVLIGRNGILGTGQRAFFPGEISGPCFAGEPGVQNIQTPVLFPAGQNFTHFADGEFSEGFMVDILLSQDILVHAINRIANHFPRRVGGDFELHRICSVIEETIRTFQLFNEITAQGQFLWSLHTALVIGIEHIGFLGRITTAGIDHGQAFPGTVLVDHIDGESGVGQLDSLAGLGIHLDQLEVAFHLLIQDVVGDIAVAGFCYTTIRLAEDTLGRVTVHRKAKGIGLEHVFRDGGLDDEILAIGQTGHTNDAFLVGEDFTQTIFVDRAGGHPAKAATIGIVTRFGQSRIIGIHQFGVAFEHPGNGLRFTSKIVLERFAVVVVLAISIQYALDVVTAVRVKCELRFLTQIRDSVDGEARAFQLGSGTGGAGGTHQLTEFKTALQNCIQALLPFPDYITGFIAIGQGFIVVDLITEIAFRVAQVIAIIGFKAFRRATFGNCGILVFVDVVGVFAVVLLQRRIITGGFQFAVQFRVLASDVKLAVGIHRQHNACSPLYQIVLAKIKIAEHQQAILDLGAGHQMILGENGQISVIPVAVGAHRGVPDGVAVLIGDFAVIHHAAHTIGVANVFRCIQVVHRTLDTGFTMRVGAGHFPVLAILSHRGGAQLIQVGFRQDDLTQHAVVLEHIILGSHGVAVLVVCETSAVGHIGPTGILLLTMDRDRGFHPLTGQELGAAGVTDGNVGIVVSVIQPDHTAVIFFGDFNVVGPLAQRTTGFSGLLNVRPVTEITIRSLGFNENEFALIALGIIHRPRGIELGAIVGAVCNGIGSVFISDYIVAIVI